MKTFIEKSKPLATESVDPLIPIINLGTADRTTWDCLALFGSEQVEQFRSAIETAKLKNLEVGFILAVGQARLDGNKEAFEDIAVDYSAVSGNSPPDWLDVHAVVKKVKVDQTILMVTDLTADNIIETTIKMENPRPLVLDLAQTMKSDAMGIELFTESLNSRLESHQPTRMLNGEKLVNNFLSKIKDDPAKQNNAVWSFVFSYYRLNGSKDLFDAASGFYKTVGGESPKWCDLSEHEAQEKKVKHKQKGFLVGESLNSMNASFARSLIKTPEVITAIQEKKSFVFDMIRMRKGSLLDIKEVVEFLHIFQHEKIPVSFVNVNEILIEMFKVMGIDRAVQSLLPPIVNA